MAEQLVEVPTVLSPALLQQEVAEQIVDNPVPRGRGARGGLPSFPQVKFRSVLVSRSSTLQFLTLVVPVEVFQVLSQDSVLWNRPLTFQFRLVVDDLFKVFAQDRSNSVSIARHSSEFFVPAPSVIFSPVPVLESF